MKRKTIIVIGFEDFSERMYPHTHAVMNALSEKFNILYNGCDDRGISLITLSEESASDDGGSWDFKRIKKIAKATFDEKKIKYKIKNFFNRNYDLVIAVDHSALYHTFHYSHKNIPIVFWSHDIITEDHPWNNYDRIRAMLSFNQLNNHRCKLYVVQDHNRGKLLDSAMGTEEGEHFYLPVSLPEDDFSRNIADRKMMGNPSGEKTRLMILGSVHEIRGSDLIIKKISEFSKEVELIIQGFISKKIRDLIGTIEIKPECHHIHKVLSDSRKIISTADIGIIHNISEISNDKYYSMACGQFVEYARMGIPVIVLFNDDIGNFVEENKCGIYIRNIRDIREAIFSIRKKYSCFSRNSYSTFKEYFDLDLYVSPLVARLDKLVSP